MLSNKEIYKKFSRKVKSLESIIEHRKLYNVFNFCMQILVKTGIAIDYFLPFIVSAIIISTVTTDYAENRPFVIDDVTLKASVQTIDTSTGYHFEKSSFDYKYDDESIEYSTGWTINDRGLYERTSTSYNIKDVDLNDTEFIFSMTEDQLKEMLVVTNVNTITKTELDEDDYIYSEDAIIVSNHYKSDENTIVKKESTLENIAHSSIYIFLSLLLSAPYELVNKFIFKNYIRGKLRNLESSFNLIKPEQIDNLKQELELNKSNLKMLSIGQANSTRKYPKLRKEYKKRS